MGKILIFHIGDTALALGLGEVRRVLHLPELKRPLPLPRIVAGYFFLDLRLYTVLDLATLLNLTPTGSDLYRSLIVLRGDAPRLALLVDRVAQMSVIDDVAEMEENASLNGILKGRCGVNPDAPFLIDPNRLLLQQERQRLQELDVRVDERLADLLEAEG